METEAMKQREAPYLSHESVIVTKSLIQQFLNDRKADGCQEGTLQSYQHSLQDLLDFLPEGKVVTKKVLSDWREALKNSGYSDNTINTRLVAVNGLLRYCGAKNLCMPIIKPRQDIEPELTRAELLRLLSAVREMGREREYLLIKVFTCVGLNICELDSLTIDALKAGVIRRADGKEKFIPDSLKWELLRYAEHQKIKKGSVFLTKSGRMMDRSNITNALRRLAKEAGLEPERCNPRALHRLYQSTHEEIMENLEPYYVQSYDKLLNIEHNRIEQEKTAENRPEYH